jgi:hypothetical protein
MVKGKTRLKVRWKIVGKRDWDRTRIVIEKVQKLSLYPGRKIVGLENEAVYHKQSLNTFL